MNAQARYHRPRIARALRQRPDRGSLSLFFAVTTLALLMITGLVVDGGGALNASDRATSLAQEAARTAGQQIDPAQAIEGTAITINPAAAQSAAQDYLQAADVRGTAEITDGGRTLTVTVHDTYTTTFAALLGRPTIDVTGTAQAHLHTSG